MIQIDIPTRILSNSIKNSTTTTDLPIPLSRVMFELPIIITRRTINSLQAGNDDNLFDVDVHQSPPPTYKTPPDLLPDPVIICTWKFGMMITTAVYKELTIIYTGSHTTKSTKEKNQSLSSLKEDVYIRTGPLIINARNRNLEGPTTYI